MPLLSITTTSPGSKSRTNVAPKWSRAQVSEAITHPLFNCPKHSGRIPRESLAAIKVSGVRATIEKAPSSVRMQWKTRSSQVCPGALANKYATTSESVVEENSQLHCVSNWAFN